MMQDPLVDWLNFSNHKNINNNSSFQTKSYGFTEFIMNRGIEFESELIKYINVNKIPVVSVSEYITYI